MDGRKKTIFWKILFFALLAAAAGGILVEALYGYVYRPHINRFLAKAQFRSNRLTAASSQYQFIDPLLGLSTPKNQFGDTKDLQKQYENLISDKQQNKKAEKISIYFRAQENGRWTGVNEDETYTPASLLKVPILIGYLKEAETHPEILKENITYNPADIKVPVKKNIPESNEEIKPGGAYTIEQLLGNMITRSDNVALAILSSKIEQDLLGRDAIKQAFDDLAVTFPADAPPGQYLISPKTYSLFFRVLYNATLLNREMSERALKLMSQTDFKDGLVAGTPDATVISHKFGLNDIQDANGNTVAIGLHDCGIIYYPKHPYSLCVMTEGTDLDDLKSVIADISRLTYQTIDAEYK